MYGPGLLVQSITETSAVATVGVENGMLTVAPCTHRPRYSSEVRGLLFVSTSWTQMNGFPPTPPCTGCLGRTIFVPARLKHPARIVFIFIRVSPFRSAPRVRGSSDDELRRSVKRLSGAVAGANRGNRRIRARKNL